MNDLSATPSLRRRTLLLLILIAILPIWFDLGSHPLSPRSEGRYASTALAMVQGQGWLIPRLEGHPHLTKPPLTYWLEAACMLVMGINEWSARIPSAAAGTLTLLIAFGLAWKIAGQRVALMTAALLAVMPLQLIISRLTITDALLNLFWTGALAAGYLAVKEPARLRWPVLLWFSVALGLMTKGPLAWVPVGCILVWLLPGKRKSDVKSLRLGWGMPASALPLIAWAMAVMFFNPQAKGPMDALRIWVHEIFTRVEGSSDLHREPIYYFIPVFIGGLFPATAMLNLPGLNYSFKSAWADLRAGRDACLWVLAVVLPFVMFSLISGKLASYLAPLCPPLAILTALMLDRWIAPDPASQPAGVKPPRVARALVLSSFGLLFVGPLLVWGPACLEGLSNSKMLQWLPRKWAASSARTLAEVGRSLGTFKANIVPDDVIMLEAGALLVLLAALWLAWTWKRRPNRRAAALAGMWLASLAFWLALLSVQNSLDNKDSDTAMLKEMHRIMGPGQATLVTYGFADSTLAFYNRQDAPRVTPADLEAQLASHPRDLIVISEENAWTGLTKNNPALTGKFEKILPWKLWTKSEPRIIPCAKAVVVPQSIPAPSPAPANRAQ